MTIEEIANELGVSKSTVSRALSGKGRIGKATIERIQAYVAEHDNLPNQYGEKKAKEEKKMAKTENIGVVIPADAYTTSIPFFQECLLGISEAAASENYNVIITTGTATDYSGAKQLVEDHKVDGMILMRSYDEDLTLEYLTKQDIPVGLTGSCSDENVIQVDSNNMEAIHSFEFVRSDAKPELPAKIYKPQRLTVQVHQNVQLPEEVKVLYRDGSIQSHKVKWENEGAVKADEIGTIFVKGQFDGLNGFDELDDEWTKPIVQEIEVVEKLMSQKNLFADANWDDGLTQWETDSSKDGVNVQLYPEFEDPFPAPPVNAVRVEGVKNFTFRISQKKKNLAPGRYVLKAQYAGTDTTGVEVHLFAEKTNDVNTQNSELFQAVIHPTKEWQEAEIHFSIEEGYTLTAGLTISAPPVYGMVRRFLLYKEEIADDAKTLA